MGGSAGGEHGRGACVTMHSLGEMASLERSRRLGRWPSGQRLVVTLAVILGVATGAGPGARASYTGTAAYLDIGMGARAMAMGGAFVAVADDATALYYNPAGLADVGPWQLVSFYSNQYQAAGYGALALAGRGLGGGVQWLRSSGIPVRDEYGNASDEFDISQTAWRLALAREVGSIAVGAALAYASDRYRETSGSGLTGDLGALMDVGSVRLGVAARHFWGARTSSTGVREPFEPQLVAGFSWRLGSLLTAAEVALMGPVRAGAEYRLGPLLALRAGAWSEDGYLNWSAGVGLAVGRAAIDYAYADAGVLGGSHRLALSYGF